MPRFVFCVMRGPLVSKEIYNADQHAGVEGLLIVLAEDEISAKKTVLQRHARRGGRIAYLGRDDHLPVREANTDGFSTNYWLDLGQVLKDRAGNELAYAEKALSEASTLFDRVGASQKTIVARNRYMELFEDE